jgi:hypothetical protein
LQVHVRYSIVAKFDQDVRSETDWFSMSIPISLIKSDVVLATKVHSSKIMRPIWYFETRIADQAINEVASILEKISWP